MRYVSSSDRRWMWRLSWFHLSCGSPRLIMYFRSWVARYLVQRSEMDVKSGLWLAYTERQFQRNSRAANPIQSKNISWIETKARIFDSCACWWRFLNRISVSWDRGGPVHAIRTYHRRIETRSGEMQSRNYHTRLGKRMVDFDTEQFINWKYPSAENTLKCVAVRKHPWKCWRWRIDVSFPWGSARAEDALHSSM